MRSYFVIKCTNRSFHERLLRNNIPHIPAMNLSYTYHSALQRTHVTTNNRLKCSNDMRSGNNRVVSGIRNCRMCTLSFDLNDESICSSHQWSRFNSNRTYWQIRLVMHTEHSLHTFKRSALHYLFGTCRIFLCGLEQQTDGSLQFMLPFFEQ
ncbi:hypothetical protein D3C81_1173910 [compost metagenome]